jgi:hypothetical protein
VESAPAATTMSSILTLLCILQRTMPLLRGSHNRPAAGLPC